MFTRRQVDRSFRKFGDICDDIQNAEFQTWEESLRHLVYHCQNDSVMQVVTEPLRNHPKVDFKKWYTEFEESGDGKGVGMYRYLLPNDDEERTALLYQFIVAATNRDFSILSFCVHAYNNRGGDDMVRSFNSEIVNKFTREVSYRLQEVETDLGESKEVESSSLMVFNSYHGSVQNIHGGVHGGIVAANSSVSDNKLTYNDPKQLAAAVKQLGDDLSDVSEEDRKSVTDAIGFLVKAIESNTNPKVGETAIAIEAIKEKAPSLAVRLRGIYDNAAGSLLSEAVKAMLNLGNQ